MITNENIHSLVKRYFKTDRQSVIDEYGPISKWDVSGVTNMSKLFSVININEDISEWDVSNVTDMSYIFYSATSFNQPLDKWGEKLSNVTNMTGMFSNAYSFNL